MTAAAAAVARPAPAPVTTPAPPVDREILSSVPMRMARYVLGALVAAYAISTLFPADVRPAYLDTWFYSVILIAVAASTLVRPMLVKRDRLAWTLVAFAVISWAAGDVYWSAAFAGLPEGAEIPVPSLADGFYIGLYPLAYFGFVALARSAAGRVSASVWLDGVVSSLAAGAVFSAVALKQILGAAEGSTAQVMTNLAYPIGDLILLVIAVAALAMVRWRPDPVWWLVGGGFALFAVADTAYLFGIARGTYTDGGWIDGLWLLGLALVALAGSLPGSHHVEEMRGFAALLVPILFSVGALTILVVGTVVRFHPATIVLAAACLVAAGIRTALTFEQTRALAASRAEAMTDELTALGNRRMLDSQLPAINASVRSGRELLAVVVSLDHLSEINNALGYPYGDALLTALGSRLKHRLPHGAVAARLGGAEIAMLLAFESDADTAERAVRELLHTISDPVVAGGVQLEVEVSAGVALGPLHADEGSDLIRCASDALHRARVTRSEVEVYDPTQDIGRSFGPGLFPELVNALDRNELVGYYQPTVDLSTGGALDLETTLRWHHPTHGIIGPDVVRPLAARAGLSRRLTRALLNEGLRRGQWWRQRGIDLAVAVDLTPGDLLDSRLPYDLARLLNEVRMPPRALQLDIAEEVLLLDPSRIQRALGQFGALGVRLALDHYGRAAPSLARLRTMPVEELKLDGSFVASVLQSAQDATVVRSTVNLARSLGIRAVATGVDSPELAAALAGYEFTGMQGAVVGEPIAAPVLPGWLDQLSAAGVGVRTADTAG